MDEKEAEARPVMGTIFLVMKCLYLGIERRKPTYYVKFPTIGASINKVLHKRSLKIEIYINISETSIFNHKV